MYKIGNEKSKEKEGLKMKKQKIVTGILTAVFAGIVVATPVNALQSRPNTTSLTNKTANYFFTEIRKMESTVLGLETNFDETTWLDSSNNGVDVHMAKNTEWGTAAMLSASAYGLAPTGTSDASTTGNATGIYQMADETKEFVAAVGGLYSEYHATTIENADSKYRNGSSTSLAGVAMTETEKWKGATSSGEISKYFPIFLRSYNALFGYSVDSNKNGSATSRAVMVLGAGL